MGLRIALSAMLVAACSSGQDEPAVPSAEQQAAASATVTAAALATTVAIQPSATVSTSASASAPLSTSVSAPSATASALPSAEGVITLAADGGTGKGFKTEIELAKYAVATAETMAPEAVRNAYPSDAILDKVITCKDPKDDQKLEVRRQIAKAIKAGPPGNAPFTYVSSSSKPKEILEKGKTYGSCTMHVTVSTHAMTIEVKDKDGTSRTLELDIAKLGSQWFVDE